VGGRPLGSRLRAARRACSLCLFCLVPSEGHGSSRVFLILGERGSGETQENKPLLPLLLRVQGKKENNVVQNGTVLGFFFLRLGEFLFLNLENNPKIGYDNVHVVARVQRRGDCVHKS